ncbi:disintegrin and metalloproteinase domain-containing protein 9 [Trichomycterus rosablanca]|uniref:disintegrin and metalloproteinase domain-containing protein 9 n=1 Tax=Trichomycterus rosablanca TaxID=2290929 RepID=UPI002F350AB2
MESRVKEADPDNVTYSIIIDNTTHFLQLTKNQDFLSPDFAVVTHDVTQDSVKTHKGKPTSCHYYGHVEGFEDSLVALSTCNGLSGVIFIGNKSYGLEPALQSLTNEHLLFPINDSKSEPFVCGTVEDSAHGADTHRDGLPLTSLIREKRSLPQTRYVELVLVVDNQRFVYKKRNVTAVKEEMVQLTNLLDSYYQQLNVRVVLLGVEIFETANPFNVDGTAQAVLQSFVKWRKSNLLPRIRNDMSQLVVGRLTPYDNMYLGMAYVGTVCSASNSGGINVFSDNRLAYFSVVVAHEMGHNLGMNHDGTNCTCGGGPCIMRDSVSGSTRFSQCSENSLEALLLKGGGVCLRNLPPQDSIISLPRCGNGLLETDEECDCGSPENCTNKCCDAATCKLTKGSACAIGYCCKDCQILVSGTPCREIVNECDLPEFCNGTSAFCPLDYYIMEGVTCQNGTAYCHEGRCQTLDYQCKQLFGQDATKGDDKCFSYVNTQGTKFGNCGYTDTESAYTPCSLANAMCGKVQCTNVNPNKPPAGAAVSLEPIDGGITCINADFNQGSDILDPAYVKTGTVCADGKVCMNFQCTNVSEFVKDQKCNAVVDCNGKGVCNDKSHCHCNNGWAPPNCTTRGRGGSVDSGPAEIDYSLRDGLLIFFLLVLPILIFLIVVLLYVFKRDAFNRCLWCCKKPK